MSSNEPHRRNARQLCTDAIARDEPLAWFDELYTAAGEDASCIPWADLAPNPNLLAWHSTSQHTLRGKRCLKIGCGLGDDCEYLQSAGGITTGLDISKTAIAWCHTRFPQSAVRYLVGDLFDAPQTMSRNYDLVVESYTLQVLPPSLRPQAIQAIAQLVADHGTLLVICRARDAADSTGEMPWPLTREEVASFTQHKLNLRDFVDFDDQEDPPVRRFLATFQRAWPRTARGLQP